MRKGVALAGGRVVVAAAAMAAAVLGGCAPQQRVGDLLAVSVSPAGVQLGKGDWVSVSVVERSADGALVAWYAGRELGTESLSADGSDAVAVSIPVEPGRLRGDAELSVHAAVVRDGRVLARGTQPVSVEAAKVRVRLDRVPE